MATLQWELSWEQFVSGKKRLNPSDYTDCLLWLSVLYLVLYESNIVLLLCEVTAPGRKGRLDDCCFDYTWKKSGTWADNYSLVFSSDPSVGPQLNAVQLVVADMADVVGIEALKWNSPNGIPYSQDRMIAFSIPLLGRDCMVSTQWIYMWCVALCFYIQLETWIDKASILREST